MDYDKFRKTLKDNGLNLKDFSKLSGVQYNTCTKWGKNGRAVSDWVESWFDLYSKNKKFEEIKRLCTEVTET